MADSPPTTQNAGTAGAGFMLAQILLWQVLQEGLLDKAQIERKLRKAVEATERGGEDAQITATELEAILRSVQAYQPPSPAEAQRVPAGRR